VIDDKKPSGLSGAAPKGRFFSIIAAILIAVLLGSGIFMGMYHGRRGGRLSSQSGSQYLKSESEQDDFSVSSKTVNGSTETEQRLVDNAGGIAMKPSKQGMRSTVSAQKQATQQAAAQEAAAEQSAREAELQKKSLELEEKAYAQAAKEKQLEEDQRRMEAERQRSQAAAAEVERRRQEAVRNETRAAAYTGPSSGNIVWQGEVRGTSLVTNNGNASDTGQIISGSLPGVLVMVQPVDGKHVGIASAPGSSNSFRRLTLRIQGNGVLQEVIRWSIP
jgi:hypothetical protein